MGKASHLEENARGAVNATSHYEQVNRHLARSVHFFSCPNDILPEQPAA